MGNAYSVLSRKNQDSGSINVKTNFENQFSTNSTKTNETGSGGLRGNNPKPYRSPIEGSSKKLTYEEPITLPTEKGMSAHKHIVTDKES